MECFHQVPIDLRGIGISDLAYSFQEIKKTIKKAPKSEISNSVKEALTVLNSSFGHTFGVGFEESLLKNSNFQKKQTPEQKRTLKRKFFREAKKQTENEFKKTLVDSVYGVRKPLRKHNKERLIKGFESVPDAVLRTEKQQQKVQQGTLKPKDHVGNISSYIINTTCLEEQAKTWSDDSKIVWDSIGKQYLKRKNSSIPGNSGQIVKKYLLGKENDDPDFNFVYQGKGEPPKEPRIKRAKKKFKGLGGKVSAAVEPSAVEAKLAKEEEVKTGTIDIGENIVGKTFEKSVINKISGELETKKFTVYGRKHSLQKLRVKLFKKHRKLMRLHSDSYFENLKVDKLIVRLKHLNEYSLNDSVDEMKQKLKALERTRYIQVWHDGSVVANHGHILFCINILYDPASFYSPRELNNDNIQREVERPEIYIIGRCGSNDEQLGYINTRLECLRSLQHGFNIREIDPTAPDIILNDKIRFFHGDGPASAFEAGNQKGGHYFCPSCNIHTCDTMNISRSFRNEYVSLSDKQNVILEGKFGKINLLKGKTLPFEKLSRSEIIDELTSRGVDVLEFKLTKKDLEPVLKEVLGGIKRIPIMFLTDPLTKICETPLCNYEIAMVEPMHDISNHVDQTLTELSRHLDVDDKALFKSYFEVFKGEKDQKRCCDWRKILLQVTTSLENKPINDVRIIRFLRTLCEIQRILYLTEDKRSAREILRLHNSCFEHFHLLKELIPIDNLSAKMSKEKLFGKYPHNLLVHGPQQYRLISGESLNVEAEERFFNLIKGITKTTTNNRPGHLIGNIVVRHEVETRSKQKYEHDPDQNKTFNDINFIGNSLYKNENNSCFSYRFIKENCVDWQAHLERISDFLIFGEGIWWTKTELGIEFHDFKNFPLDERFSPIVHHFRSSDMKKVRKDLSLHWKHIIENNVKIPLHKICISDEYKTIEVKDTNYLDEIDRVITDKQLQDFNMEIPTPLLSELPDDGDCDTEEVHSFKEIDSYDSSTTTILTRNDTSTNEVGNSSKNSVKCSSYITKEAHAIFLILGDSHELSMYDKRKDLFKKNKAFPNTLSILKSNQNNFKTKVINELKILKEKFEIWEKSFFHANDCCSPTLDDVKSDPIMGGVCKKIQIATKLIERWNKPDYLS